jgi:hypothetical protein
VFENIHVHKIERNTPTTLGETHILLGITNPSGQFVRMRKAPLVNGAQVWFLVRRDADVSRFCDISNTSDDSFEQTACFGATSAEEKVEVAVSAPTSTKASSSVNYSLLDTTDDGRRGLEGPIDNERNPLVLMAMLDSNSFADRESAQRRFHLSTEGCASAFAGAHQGENFEPIKVDGHGKW